MTKSLPGAETISHAGQPVNVTGVTLSVGRGTASPPTTLSEVERLCSHVLMLKQGRIVDRGSPQDLLDRYGREDMEEVFLDIARDRRRAVAPVLAEPAAPAASPV